MNKRLIFVILFVVFFCTGILPEALSAEDSKAPFLKNDEQGLKSDFNSLSAYRAEKGLRNLEAYSLVLIKKGLKAYSEKNTEEAIIQLEQAKELSPDLPLPSLYLARINFSFSFGGLSSASGFLLEALRAFLNNFRWSFQTAGMLSISLYFACYIAVVVFLIALIFTKLPLYVHDINENKQKFYFLLPAVILAFLGPVIGLIGFIIPFWIYIRGRERVLASCSLLIVLVMVFVAPMVSSFLNGLKDRTLQTIVKINEGIYTGDNSVISNSEQSYEAAFAGALDLKRKGFYKEAIAIYSELLKEKEDAKIYNNLANAYIGLGNNDLAMSFYDKAVQTKKMASTYFNLSQIYREKFDFNNAKDFFLKALEVDPEKVGFYNSIKGTTANSFVMDEALDNWELWQTAFKVLQDDKSIAVMISFVNREFSIILVFIMIILLYISDKYISSGAYRCKRCGEIYCNLCEKKITSDNVCHSCYRTLVSPGELTPQLRVEKILQIQRSNNRKNQTLKFLALFLPGVGHIYYGWTVSGFIRLFLFSFFFFSAALWRFIPVPVSMNTLSFAVQLVSAAGFVMVYLSTVVNIFRRVP